MINLHQYLTACSDEQILKIKLKDTDDFVYGYIMATGHSPNEVSHGSFDRLKSDTEFSKIPTSLYLTRDIGVSNIESIDIIPLSEIEDKYSGSISIIHTFHKQMRELGYEGNNRMHAEKELLTLFQIIPNSQE